MKLGIIFCVALALAACCPTPPPVEPVEKGPAPSSAEVCLHLADLACPEGLDPICQRKIDQVQHDRLVLWPTRCWVAAKTRADARACGQLACASPP